MRNRAHLVGLLLVLILSASIMNGSQFEPFSHILYGPVEQLGFFGDHLIGASGSYLLVLDESFEIEGAVPIGERIDNITIEGNWCYVATYDGNIKVVDLSLAPDAPVSATLDIGGIIEDMAVCGNRLYAATTNGLYAIDIERPWSPSIDDVFDSGTYYLSVVCNGSVIFGGKQHGDVRAYSSTGELAGSVTTLGRVSDMLLKSNNLYIIDNWRYISVYDISNPSAMTSLSVTSMTGPLSNLYEDDNLLYVSSAVGRISVVDIDSPESPSVLSTFLAGEIFYEMALNDGYLYTAALFGGIYKLDARNPYDLEEEDIFEKVGYVNKVVGNGDYAYVAYGPGGLITLDVADPSNPYIAQQDQVGYASEIEILDDYMYVLDEAGYIDVFDITLPHAPELVNQIYFPSTRLVGLELNVSLEGDPYLYTMKFAESIVTMDISIPTSPHVVWETDLHSTAGLHLDQVWSFLSVTTSSTIELYDDLFWPAEPRWYNHFGDLGLINDISSIDNTCIVATEDNGAHIIELNHTVPLETHLVTIDGFERVSSAYAHQHFAMLATDNEGISCYDMKTNYNPLKVDQFVVSQAREVTVDSETGLIYVSRGTDGLEIIGGNTIFETNLQLTEGWNTISLPINSEYPRLGLDIPSSAVGCFEFDPESRLYESVTTLEPGKGYFYFSDIDTVVFLDGADIDPITIELAPGWNLIGTGSERINANSLAGRSSLVAQFYYFDQETGSYLPEEETLEPDRAYWVLALDNLVFNLHHGTISLGKDAIGTPHSPTEFSPFPPALPGTHIADAEPEALFSIDCEGSNPFNSATVVAVALPDESDVSIKVYDVSGKIVDKIMNTRLAKGSHSVRWVPPANIPSGLYMFRVDTEFGTASKKLLYTR